MNLLMSGISLTSKFPGKTNFSPIEMLSSFMDSMRDSVSVKCDPGSEGKAICLTHRVRCR